VLDDHGLGVALQRYVADYSETQKIAVDLTLDRRDMIDVPRAVQLAIFRIVQEALTNVSRHSAATAIRIRVARSAMGLETTVTDNGSGFETEAERINAVTHLGLKSMRERAAILGGAMNVTSGATGTTIMVHIPLEHRDSKAP
jgi:signal transduction histidine kinase